MNASAYSDHVRELAARHDRALEDAGFDAAVIYSGSAPIQFLDDNPYPFKVNPLFKSWVPLTDVPDSFLVHVPGERPRLIYFQPEDYWHLPPADPEGEWTQAFDIRIVRKVGEARAHLPGGRVAFLGEMRAAFEDWGVAAVNPAGVIDALHYARAWKTDYEIDCMAAASTVGVRGHRAAERAFRDGASEYEIHLAYCKACSLTESELPYSNIVALNEHAAVLHYTHHDREAPDTPRSFLIDAGGSYRGYASDITRTYSHADDTFRALIDAVDGVQQALCDSLRPGVDYPTLHLDAHFRLASVLVDAGIVTCNAQDAVDNGLSARFFPHGLGHYIGLQVHDVGGFMADGPGSHVAPPEAHPYLRLTRRVDARQVMTVEPGVYFIPSLLEPLRPAPLGQHVDWDLVDRFYPCGGIRIEDNVLVTPKGARNLTREAFARG